MNADPEKFGFKEHENPYAHGWISENYREDCTIEEFRSALLRELCADGMERCVLSEDELQTVRLLAQKYRSWDWTYGRSPSYGYKNKKRFPGGTLKVTADIRNGILEDICFSGDFMARRELCEAEKALRESALSVLSS